jgi:FtsP/CotA-like multicopper oxidase with cupredoxin domain
MGGGREAAKHRFLFIQRGESMIGPDLMTLRTASNFRTGASRRYPAWRMCGWIALFMVAAALAVGAISLASAQNPPRFTPPNGATSTTETCFYAQKDANNDLVMPPEIDFDENKGVLKIISLAEEFQLLPPSAPENTKCAKQLVRVYRPGLPLSSNELRNPVPGPTLRARVGDLVQLTFVNTVNANRFDRNVVLVHGNPGDPANGCMQVKRPTGPNKTLALYPAKFDKMPNCLHASSTANIHYHGTHTNPDTTGDNVFLEILPLPRDNAGQLTTTPAEAMVGLEQFFGNCAAQLKDPLNQWPKRWSDMPKEWIHKQTELLQAYQAKHPDEMIWDADEKQIADGWPQYYIGVVPYCFVLPYKPEDEPVDKGVLRMGQAPGTHWYHAHKHGSTAINVLNGMTGAFIIEGQYDDELNAFYGSYVVKRGDQSMHWNTSFQPVLVLNQIATTPNLLAGGGEAGPAGPAGIPIAVNGRFRPKAHMQPGEVQLWRIANSSSRSAAYFMAPEAVASGCPERLQWRQLAQDGVQFAQGTYDSPQNQNRPFYLAPANRVDLLVQAPMTKGTCNVLIQAVMARGEVRPMPVKPDANDPAPGTVLMTVDVSGDPVTKDGEPVQMPFPLKGEAPEQPKFLADITDQEWARSNYATNTFTFDSKGPKSPVQHTINGIQFKDGAEANVPVRLGAVEQWTIKNTTNAGPDGPGLIDHPFHIHINPYQITEVFDPNEGLVDPATGEFRGVLAQKDEKRKTVTDEKGNPKIMSQSDCDNLKDGTHCETIQVPRYVTDKALLTDKNNPFRGDQCFIDPDPAKENTWSAAGARRADNSPCEPLQPQSKHLIWWDTFAIPSARFIPATGEAIPGYFKMRSRFVDYQGVYVMHCHILIHEDRGMMFTVEVRPSPTLMVTHH